MLDAIADPEQHITFEGKMKKDVRKGSSLELHDIFDTMKCSHPEYSEL